MALSMRGTAEFVYERLTNLESKHRLRCVCGAGTRNPLRYLLAGVYGAYGFKASAKSRARRRKHMAKKRENSL